MGLQFTEHNRVKNKKEQEIVQITKENSLN
jgi:hypothetical protein